MNSEIPYSQKIQILRNFGALLTKNLAAKAVLLGNRYENLGKWRCGYVSDCLDGSSVGESGDCTHGCNGKTKK